MESNLRNQKQRWLSYFFLFLVLPGLFLPFFIAPSEYELRTAQSVRASDFSKIYASSNSAHKNTVYAAHYVDTNNLQALTPKPDIYVDIQVELDRYIFSGEDIQFEPSLATQLQPYIQVDPFGRIISIRKGFVPRFTLVNINEKLENIRSRYYIPPLPSEVKFNADTKPYFSCNEDIPGWDIDISTIKLQIETALVHGKSCHVVTAPKLIRHELSREKIQKSFYLRSKFSTNYAGSSLARIHNIRKALSAFHGLVLPPKSTLSFNQTTGRRTIENGYLEAKIIAQGKFIEGIGGGVCQSSTTLYNALLLADVQIDKVRNHSLKVGYVSPSFDAMVNISTSDLAFTNATDNYLYIRSTHTPTDVTVEIYGEKLPYTIRRRSVIREEYPAPPEQLTHAPEYQDHVKYDDEWYIITPSKSGLKSEGFLDYYQGNTLLKSVKIRTDHYNAMTGIAVRGKEKRPKKNELQTDTHPKC